MRFTPRLQGPTHVSAWGRGLRRVALWSASPYEGFESLVPMQGTRSRGRDLRRVSVRRIDGDVLFSRYDDGEGQEYARALFGQPAVAEGVAREAIGRIPRRNINRLSPEDSVYQADVR